MVAGTAFSVGAGTGNALASAVQRRMPDAKPLDRNGAGPLPAGVPDGWTNAGPDPSVWPWTQACGAIGRPTWLP